MEKSNNLLIYAGKHGGHRTEFVEYMLDYFIEVKSSEQINFLIHGKIYQQLEDSIEAAKRNSETLIVDKISNEVEAQLDNAKNVFSRSLIEKKLLASYFEAKNIQKLILLELDAYQYVLGTWANSKHAHIQVNGIMFSPYIQEIEYSDQNNFRNRLRLLRKKFQLKWILRHKGINRIYVLNDIPGAEKLNNIMGSSSNFQPLPDPLKVRPYNKIDIRQKYGIDADKKILLAVGGVQRRKNILSIIKGVESLDSNVSKNTCLLILGKCFDEQLLSEINTLVKQSNNCQIVFENKLLDSDEFESAVEESYLMFTIYKDFYSSSGIVNHAAKHGKCTIASEQGVIGYVTKKYNLGVTVNPTSDQEIKEAIVNCLTEKNIDRYNNDFVEERHYKKFAKALLEFN